MEFETKKILLIEGNNDVAQTIRKYLVEASDQMFVVECENCLSEGLIHINRGDIDAILLDLYLPDSQGINTFTKIHGEVPEVPVIVLTDFDKDGMAHEVVRNGAQDYLLKKNIDGNMLARSVVYAIERHQKLVKFQLNESKIQNRLTLFCKSLNPFSNFKKKRSEIPSLLWRGFVS